MFLHSGASIHGHEYSTRPLPAASPQAPPNLRSPLLRSALTPAKPRASQGVDGPTLSVLRQRPASDYIPRKIATPEPVVRFQEVEEEDNDDGDEDRATAVMHEDHLLSESELSEATVFSTDGPLSRSLRTRGTRRRRRAPHTSTKFLLGYPAPKRLGKTKVMQKVLPRLLLQLQRVSDDGRSRPVLEVYPSSRIAGPVITPRLAKRFPGIFGVKRQLSYDDMVLVKRDDDGAVSDADHEGDEHWESKMLLAVYSPLKHSDEAEIVLEDGSVWVAKPLPSGSFDFVHTDIHGISTTVRWARRSMSSSAASGAQSDSVVPASPSNQQARFTFSVLSPLTRRHPVMATLTLTSLEVQDTYTSVTTSYGRYPPHRAAGRTVSMTSSCAAWADTAPEASSKRSSLGSADGCSDSGIMALPSELEATRAVLAVDDATKTLISVTALWVALRSGWSANYTRNNTELLSPSCSGRSRRNTWTRTTTTETGGRQTPQVSESEDRGPERKRHSMPPPSTEKHISPPPSRSTTPVSSPGNRPHRATSTGAAYMQQRLRESEGVERDGSRKPTNGARSSATWPLGEKSKPRSEPVPEANVSQRFDGAVDSATEIDRNVRREKETAKKGMRSRISRWMHKIGVR
ncbi:hypothetical protein OQA88_9052 [Cercophora sp. LCS_1]